MHWDLSWIDWNKQNFFSSLVKILFIFDRNFLYVVALEFETNWNVTK